MKLDTIIEETFYTYVAPDGTIQVTLLAPDGAMCMEIAQLFSENGIGQSPVEMNKKGFHIEKFKVTIIPYNK